jgi:hypothetical protein
VSSSRLCQKMSAARRNTTQLVWLICYSPLRLSMCPQEDWIKALAQARVARELCDTVDGSQPLGVRGKTDITRTVTASGAMAKRSSMAVHRVLRHALAMIFTPHFLRYT